MISSRVKSALTRAYDTLRPYSDRHRWEFYPNLQHLNFLATHVPAGATILDVGSGIGILALALNYLGYAATGIDKHIFLPNTYLSVADISGLQRIWEEQHLTILAEDIFSGADQRQYDCVANIAVIEHQKDPKRFLDACIRRLRPGGYWFCVTPNMVDLLNRARFLCGRSAFRDLRPFFDTGENFVGHWREYTLSELVDMTEWSGLKVLAKRNCRTEPYFNGKDKFPRSVLLAVSRFLANAVPTARDANLVFAQKVAKI